MGPIQCSHSAPLSKCRSRWTARRQKPRPRRPLHVQASPARPALPLLRRADVRADPRPHTAAVAGQRVNAPLGAVNRAYVCDRCNNKKSDRTLIEWLAFLIDRGDYRAHRVTMRARPPRNLRSTDHRADQGLVLRRRTEAMSECSQIIRNRAQPCS